MRETEESSATGANPVAETLEVCECGHRRAWHSANAGRCLAGDMAPQPASGLASPPVPCRCREFVSSVAETGAMDVPDKLLADLVAAIDRCQSGIDGAFMLAHVHGQRYNGPTYSQEIQRAREYLYRRAPSGEPEGGV